MKVRVNQGERPKNLLILSGFWPTESNPITGIFVVQQVAAIADLGCKITVVLTKTLGKPMAPYLSLENLGLPEEQVSIVEVPVVRLPEKFSNLAAGLKLNLFVAGLMYRRGIAKISRSHGPFDGCIIHGIRYSGLSLPAWRGRVDGSVLVVMHGVDPFFNCPMNVRRARNSFLRVSNLSDSVVVVGTPLIPHALKLGILREKIQVVANGTNLPCVDPVSKFPTDKKRITRIVSVSNLVTLKGIDYNLHALADIANRRADLSWIYIIIGDGPERSRLELLAKSLGILGNVKFSGRIPYEKTMQEISKSDIFSLPSWGEAFGIVYLEAMARCKPVIGCLENGAADVITDGKEGLLIPPHDTIALVKALEKLLDNPEFCHELGDEGRKTVEKYSWENNAKAMFSLMGFEERVHF